jgi:hypothetical protein
MVVDAQSWKFLEGAEKYHGKLQAGYCMNVAIF